MSSHLISFRNILFLIGTKASLCVKFFHQARLVLFLQKSTKKRLASRPDVCCYFLIDFLAPSDSIDLPGHIARLIGS